MPVDRASELANLAREVGAEILEGALRYPSETGSWRLGDVDLGEYLDKYRDQRLMIVFVPTGKAEKETVTCGICGFLMDKAGECPRCKFLLDYTLSVEKRIQERQELFEDIEDLLQDGTPPGE
jgi:hypothetical protein